MSYAQRTVVSVVLSVLVHPLLLGLYLLLPHDRAPRKPKPQPVSLRTIDSKRWAENRGRFAGPVAERPVPIHPRGQVVDVAPGNRREDPHAKYLAETANTVKAQSRAREQTAKYSLAAPKNAPRPEVLPSERGRAGGSADHAVSASSFLEGLPSLDGFRPRLSLLEPEAARGHGDAKVTSEDDRGTMASVGEAARGSDATENTTGGGAPNDDLQDVPVGDGTFLNTREWKYAGFFNRVKQAVSARWDPNGRLRSRSYRADLVDRHTVLQVALRPDGSLADVYVEKSCGLDYLDQEAVAAFERAQPFANPPPALVENGFIHFAFSFSVVNEGLARPHL